MKKWTYLVAACMLAGATPVFTGCVDNDEPAGITELRGAKAQLLKAQAEVQLANAAYRNVEVELKKLEQGLLEAEIAIKNAEAARAEALAQATQDSLDIVKKAYDMKIERLRAQTDAYVKQQEAIAKEAEVRLTEAIKNLALAKATLSDDQWGQITQYTSKVTNAQALVKARQNALNDANETLDDAIRALKEDSLNTTELRKLQTTYNEKVIARDAQAELVAQLNEAMELAQSDANANEWTEELNKLNAQMDSLEVLNAELDVLAAKFRSEHLAQYNQMMDSLNLASDYGYVAADGSTYTYEDENGVEQTKGPQNNELFKIEGDKYSKEWNIASFQEAFGGIIALEIADSEYNYSSYINGANYIANGGSQSMIGYQPFGALNEIDFVRTTVEKFTLNTNGTAWTTNDRAQAEAAITANKETFKEDSVAWQKVVDAYKYAGAVTDPLKLDEGKALSDSIDLYNASAAANLKAWEALKGEQDKLQASLRSTSFKRYNTQANADPDFPNSSRNAENAKYDDYADFRSDLVDFIGDENDGLVADSVNTKAEWERLKGAYPDPTESQRKQINDAKADYDAASEVLAEARETLKAWDASATAIAGTDDNDNIREFGDFEGGYEKDWLDAYREAEADYNGVEKAYHVYSQLFYGQIDNTGDINLVVKRENETLVLVPTIDDPTVPERAYGSDYTTAMINADVLACSQDDLIPALREASAKAFGRSWDLNSDQNNLRLVAPTEAEVIADIKARYQRDNGVEMPDYMAQFYYAQYGSFGSVLDAQAEYNRADYYLKNGNEDLAVIIEDLNNIEKDFRAEMEANIEMVDNLIAYFETQNAEYNAAYKEEVGMKVEEASFAKEQIVPVLQALQGAIQGYLGVFTADNADLGNMYGNSIEELVESIQYLIEGAEKDLAEKENAVIDAQEAIARYEAGDRGEGRENLLYAINDARAEVERISDLLQEAQDDLTAATAELQRIIDAVLASVSDAQ